MAQGLKEHGMKDFDLKACSCGKSKLAAQLCSRKSKGMLDANFIEGMACIPADASAVLSCLTHGEKNKKRQIRHGGSRKDHKRRNINTQLITLTARSSRQGVL